MNAKGLLIISAFVVTSALRAQDQPLTVGELPPPAQRALNDAAKNDPIKTIIRRTLDGRTVYEVELERKNALNPRFHITEEGIVVAGMPRSTSDAATELIPYYEGISAPAAFDPMVPVEELPAAVRETIKKEQAGRPIADIDRERWQGRIVYEVEFKAPGRNPQVHIAEDGTLVKAESARDSEASTSGRSLLLGTQLEDTPPAVQATIRREARGRMINDIDLKRRKGERIYEVEIGDGRTVFHIHVAEDGRILYDTRPGDAPAKRG